MAVSLVALIAWFQISCRNDYDILDTLRDPVSGKASQDPLIVYFMAGLSGWYVVVKTINPAAGNAGSDLVQILAIFLIYRAGKQGIEAWKVKPPSPPAPPDAPANLNINAPNADTVNTQGVQPVSTQPTLPSAIRTIQA